MVGLASGGIARVDEIVRALQRLSCDRYCMGWVRFVVVDKSSVTIVGAVLDCARAVARLDVARRLGVAWPGASASRGSAPSLEGSLFL